MTSMDKEIIPLQHNDGNLAFNIQSIEAIKYTEENLANEIERAIRKILNAIEKEKKFEESKSANILYIKKVHRILELVGFDKYNVFIQKIWIESCKGTIFHPYINKGYLSFIGIVDKETKIDDIHAETRILLSRLDKIVLNYENEVGSLLKKKDRLEKGEEEVNSEIFDNFLYSRPLSPSDRKEIAIKNVISNIEKDKNYIQVLHFVKIIIITMDDAKKYSRIAEVINNLETKMKHKNAEIWDEKKIEEYIKKLGLNIGD